LLKAMVLLAPRGPTGAGTTWARGRIEPQQPRAYVLANVPVKLEIQ